jgi:hypothetical protein
VSARQLVEALLKAWAVVTLVGAVSQLPTFLVFLSPSPMRGQTWGFALGIIFTVVAAVLLIRFAEPLSHVLIRASELEPIPASSLLLPFIVTLGVYLLVSGLRGVAVVGLELLLAQSWANVGAAESVWARERTVAFSGAAEAIGGLLVLRFRNRIPVWLSASADNAA